MEDRKIRTSLAIRAANDGGFVVGEAWNNGMAPNLLFAGSLSACLTYIEGQMAPPVNVGDLSREELEKGYADALRPVGGEARGIGGGTGPAKPWYKSPDIDWSGIRDPEVSPAELTAEAKAQAEWDAGAAAAYRAIGKAWREKQEKVPFKYPPGPDIDPRLPSIVRMLEDKARASMAAYLSWVEVQIILAALREKYPQYAGSTEKGPK